MSRKLYHKPDLKGRRQSRISQVIRRAIANLFLEKFREYEITVTEVDTSPDLSSAKVYVVSHNDKEKEIMDCLKEQSHAIRKSLGERVDLRSVPTLHFFWDKSFDHVTKIHNLLQDEGLDNS